MSFFDDFGSGSQVPSWRWLPGVFGEIVVLLLFYRFFFFGVLRTFLERRFSKASWWAYLLTFRGLFCENVQKEILYLTLLGVHHCIGGGLMLVGSLYGSGALWLQGFIFEIVDDVHDSWLMLAPAWPFATENGGEKRDMKLMSLLMLHHICGILCFVPVILTGLFENSYMQTIGWSLLLAGGVSCVVLAINRTINRNTPDGARNTFIVWMVNLSFYYWARWWVFPKAVYGFFSTGWDTIETSTRVMLVSATVLMFLFNIAICLDATVQAVELLQNALNGGKKATVNEAQVPLNA